jgi:hypothetical protein
MGQHQFSRSLMGYDADAVDVRLAEMDEEITSLRNQLFEAKEANTALRLSVGQQIEEASAEAAVVLGHARSEATRIRERAVEESDTVLEDAHRTRTAVLAEATEAKEKAEAERLAQVTKGAEIVSDAQARAAEILRRAAQSAASLEAQAEASKDDAARKSTEMDEALRLRRLELDRMEIDVREQADAYAMQVYREADNYARDTQGRALDLERQAEEILTAAKRAAQDTQARAVDSARRNLESALGIVNTIFSEVNGSLVDVSRIRQVLGDAVDRLSITEGPRTVTTVQEPSVITSNAESSHD